MDNNQFDRYLEDMFAKPASHINNGVYDEIFNNVVSKRKRKFNYINIIVLSIMGILCVLNKGHFCFHKSNPVAQIENNNNSSSNNISKINLPNKKNITSNFSSENAIQNKQIKTNYTIKKTSQAQASSLQVATINNPPQPNIIAADKNPIIDYIKLLAFNTIVSNKPITKTTTKLQNKSLPISKQNANYITENANSKLKKSTINCLQDGFQIGFNIAFLNNLVSLKQNKNNTGQYWDELFGAMKKGLVGRSSSTQSIRLNLQYKNWFFQTGLQNSNLSFTHNFNLSTYKFPVFDNSGKIIAILENKKQDTFIYTTYSAKTTFQMKYISIPLTIGYTCYSNKYVAITPLLGAGFYASYNKIKKNTDSAGVETNYFINDNKFSIEGLKKDYLRNFNMDLHIGLNIKFKISEKLSINIQGTNTAQLFDIFKNNLKKPSMYMQRQRIYGIGLNYYLGR